MHIGTVGTELSVRKDRRTEGQTERLRNMTMIFTNLSATLKLQASTLSINKLYNLLHIVTSHRNKDQSRNNLVLMI